MDLDAGDFDAVIPYKGTGGGNSQQGNEIPNAGKEGTREPQSIKTSHKWDRRKVIDWGSIREAMVAGMSAEDCAARYGSTSGSIRVRSHAEQWPTPERVKREAEKQIAEAQERLQRAREMRQRPPGPRAELRDGAEFGGEEGLMASSAGSGSENIAVMLASDLVGMAESGTLHAARRALRSLKQAPESLPIRGASDLAILAKLLRSMAGLDSPQVAVNLELFSSQAPAPESLGVAIDLETGEE